MSAKPSLARDAEVDKRENRTVDQTATPGSHVEDTGITAIGARRTRAGMIKIELGGGCRVCVDRDVDGDALCRALDVLRRRCGANPR